MAHTKVVVVTGTDTGVGKTVATALLLCFLRQHGVSALAIKPFCSGSRGDIALLSQLQNEEIRETEICPYFSAEPVTPMIGLERHGVQPPRLSELLNHIKRLKKRCEVLLVEGVGGLLTPLAADLKVLDLICALKCPALVVAANRLGALNHTLLTTYCLQTHGVRKINVMLMSHGDKSLAARLNSSVLARELKGTPMIEMPFLGRNAKGICSLQRSSKNQARLLVEAARLAGVESSID